MSSDFDAVVVGGGPSGSLSAIELSKLGWRVLLVERGERHRDKACGHCLNPRAIEMLVQSGLGEAVRPALVGDYRRLCVCSGTASALVELPRQGVLAPRSLFDQALRDAAADAGVEVWHEASAMAFDFHRDAAYATVRVNGECQAVRAPLLVGADGLGSAVARAAGLNRRTLRNRKWGFSFDWPTARPPTLKPNVVFMFLHRAGGYLGLVCSSDSLIHIAGLMPSGRRPGADRNLASWMCDLVMQHEVLGECGLSRFQPTAIPVHAIGPMPWRTHANARRRVALVGDAAGYVEPFTGEGMTWAIHSAMTLASCLCDVSPGTWNEALADRYRRAWRTAIGSRQRVCRGLAVALERPRVTRLMIRIGDRFPRLSRTIARQVVKS